MMGIDKVARRLQESCILTKGIVAFADAILGCSLQKRASHGKVSLRSCFHCAKGLLRSRWRFMNNQQRWDCISDRPLYCVATLCNGGNGVKRAAGSNF